MSDQEEFEKWAWKYADDEDAWEDMGRDEIFIAGMKAERDKSERRQLVERKFVIGDGEFVGIEHFHKRFCPHGSIVEFYVIKPEPPQ